ncbi:hypothetical protein BH10ACT3_BH10ACT3_04360 [soil metagenome]
MIRKTPASSRARAPKLLLGIAALAVIGLSACGMTPPPAATPVVVFDNSPAAVASSYQSLGYAATSTKELGDLVQLDGTARKLTSAKLTLVTWAYQSAPINSAWCTNHQLNCDALTGWDQPVKVTIYAAGGTNAAPTLGAVLGTATATVRVPWRPEPDPDCPENRWKDADGVCNNGLAFEADVNFASSFTAPDEVIFGISYNTTNYGATPYGGPGGPYDSLNVALSDSDFVGNDKQPNIAFWNTSFPGFYTDGGAAGVGIFRADTGWAGQEPMIELYATT